MENLKKTIVLFSLFTALGFSCEKEHKGTDEEYIVFYKREFLKSVPVDTIDEIRGRQMIDSISRHLLTENEIDSTKISNIFYFGGTGSGFLTTLTLVEAKKVKNDIRVKSIDKNNDNISY